MSNMTYFAKARAFEKDACRRNPVWLVELFERIEYLESGTPEVLIVACGDGQPMPPGGGRDVAVLNRHMLAGLVEQPFLIRPYVCD